MAIFTKENTKTELIQYLHGYCFIPTTRTFLKEIKNRKFLTWPDHNNQALVKHLPPSIVTSLGHLDQERKNLQYTKHEKSEGGVEEDSDFHFDAEIVKTHDVCATIIPLSLKRKVFSDLTGALPHKTSRGH